ncbi:MAG TPA: PilZ domain-containing protein [Spirochaetota bacterium]|nr:PilZ domain-containing protein [Spirochaetota bacterium]HPQ52902.1 PilZ domain-containing protein [Spirochaetota bacterium]
MYRSLDKREHERIRTSRFVIEYMVKGFDAVYKAEVINVSAGGLCYLRDAIVKKGDEIKIKFPFKTKKVVFAGEVVRVVGREVGVQFIEDEERIELFIGVLNKEYPALKAGKDSDEDTYGSKKKKKDSDNYLDIEP